MILWPAIFSNRYVETCGNKTIANALTVKDTSQTGGVWFYHLRDRDLAYAQPDSPAKKHQAQKKSSYKTREETAGSLGFPAVSFSADA